MEWVSIELVERCSSKGKVGFVLDVDADVGLEAEIWSGEGKENDLTFEGE